MAVFMHLKCTHSFHTLHFAVWERSVYDHKCSICSALVYDESRFIHIKTGCAMSNEMWRERMGEMRENSCRKKKWSHFINLYGEKEEEEEENEEEEEEAAAEKYVFYSILFISDYFSFRSLLSYISFSFARSFVCVCEWVRECRCCISFAVAFIFSYPLRLRVMRVEECLAVCAPKKIFSSFGPHAHIHYTENFEGCRVKSGALPLASPSPDAILHCLILVLWIYYILSQHREWRSMSPVVGKLKRKKLKRKSGEKKTFKNYTQHIIIHIYIRHVRISFVLMAYHRARAARSSPRWTHTDRTGESFVDNCVCSLPFHVFVDIVRVFLFVLTYIFSHDKCSNLIQSHGFIGALVI